MTFKRYGRVQISSNVRALCFPAVCFLALAMCAMPAQTAPRTYSIDTKGSLVQFSWDFGTTESWGRMPLVKADVSIDFEVPGRSQIAVAVDARNAQAGFLPATQAMRGPSVLDAKAFPLITFVSERITRTSSSTAEIDGNITIRDVTRPIHLRAQIYRQSGSDPTDLSNLTILLTGAVERSNFGASGWSDMVGNKVRLRILARIHQVD